MCARTRCTCACRASTAKPSLRQGGREARRPAGNVPRRKNALLKSDDWGTLRRAHRIACDPWLLRLPHDDRNGGLGSTATAALAHLRRVAATRPRPNNRARLLGVRALLTPHMNMTKIHGCLRGRNWIVRHGLSRDSVRVTFEAMRDMSFCGVSGTRAVLKSRRGEPALSKCRGGWTTVTRWHLTLVCGHEVSRLARKNERNLRPPSRARCDVCAQGAVK